MGPVNSNQYGRVDVTFSDIDVPLDVDGAKAVAKLNHQLSRGKQVSARAFAAVIEEVNSQIQEVYSGGKRS